MLNNFSLGAIVSIDSKGGKGIIILDLGDEFCNNISTDWNTQYREFIEGKRDKPYNSESEGEKFTYEYFVVESYELPDFMSVINDGIINTENISRIPRNHGVERDKVLCFFGVAKDSETNHEIILFQNISAGKIIAPWRCLSEAVLHPIQELTRRNLYTESTKNKGHLVLDSKLTAIYNSDTKQLLFNNHFHTNKTLPIPDYRIKKITNERIKCLLSHPIFKCRHKDSIANRQNIEIRLCFAKLRDDNILDDIILDLLIEDAEENDVDITIENNQIVVPEDDEKIINLLMLINGDLTERKFTTTPEKFKIRDKEKR